MKTYEEMASAVLTRAKAKRLQRRRRVLAACSAAAVVCLVLTAVLLLEILERQMIKKIIICAINVRIHDMGYEIYKHSIV